MVGYNIWISYLTDSHICVKVCRLMSQSCSAYVNPVARQKWEGGGGWIACIYVISRANINLNLKLSVKWEELISYWLLPTGKHSQKAVYLALSGRKREACSFVSHSIPQLHPSLRKWSRNGFHSLADMIAACRGQKSVFFAFLKVCHILEK